MGGPTGTEKMMGAVMQTVLQKALSDPSIAGHIETFLKMVSDIKERQARVESKLDEILSIVSSQKDPQATENVLDRLALMAPEELQPLVSNNQLFEEGHLPGPNNLYINTRQDLPSDWLLKNFSERQLWLDDNPLKN